MLATTPHRLALILTFAASALGVVACGSGSDRDVSQIKQTIKDFALASGPHSCDFLTADAMQGLFAGGGRLSGTTGRHSIEATCRARSTSFTGEPVEISRVWFPAPHEAKAYAHRIGAHANYTVTLRKSRRRWRINHVTY